MPKSLLKPLFNGVLVLIYYFKKHFFFFILKTFCSTLNSWIVEFVFDVTNRLFFLFWFWKVQKCPKNLGSKIAINQNPTNSVMQYELRTFVSSFEHFSTNHSAARQIKFQGCDVIGWNMYRRLKFPSYLHTKVQKSEIKRSGF